jgi:hypothetical protein
MDKLRLAELRRIGLMAVGIALIILGTLLGPIPGPLGLPVAVVGLILVLRSSRWAKRKYAAVKRRWPKLLSMPDRLLRRRKSMRPVDN